MKLGDFINKKHCTVKYSAQQYDKLYELLTYTVNSLAYTMTDCLNTNAMLHLAILNKLRERMDAPGAKQITFRHEEAFAFIYNMEAEAIREIFQECPYTTMTVQSTIEQLKKHYSSPAPVHSRRQYRVTNFP